MADIELVIKISEEKYNMIKNKMYCGIYDAEVYKAIASGTLLFEGHGRLGDLDELEQRISNFVEHDAKITDEYTVVRQRFIVDGIRQTPTIIEADKAESEDKCKNCEYYHNPDYTRCHECEVERSE